VVGVVLAVEPDDGVGIRLDHVSNEVAQILADRIVVATAGGLVRREVVEALVLVPVVCRRPATVECLHLALVSLVEPANQFLRR